jgi:GNAT superfamily N-acetyltransferase
VEASNSDMGSKEGSSPRAVGQGNLRSDFELRFSSDVSERALSEFYDLAFPLRARKLKLYRNWYYSGRSVRNINRWPVVAVDRTGRIIGHAGTIPNLVNIAGRSIEASWFVDFFVLPEARGLGVGQSLMDKVMTASPIMMAIAASPDSLPMFRKYGWFENQETYHVSLPTRPSEFAKLRTYFGKNFPKILDVCVARYVHAISKGKSVINVSDVLDASMLEQTFNVMRQGDPNNASVIQRNTDYFNWRVIKNPLGGRYQIYSTDCAHALGRIMVSKARKELNILLLQGKNLEQILSGILSYAMNERVARVSFLSSMPVVAQIVPRWFWIKRNTPPFFYSEDKGLMEKLTTNTPELSLIDSDLDLSLIDDED